MTTNVSANTNPGRIEPLGPHHDRASFECGAPELDRYLRQVASQDVKNNVAAVHVLAAGPTIKGFYAMSAASLPAEAIPETLRKGLPKYKELPVILLGRLAVDKKYHGQGVGRVLIDSVFQRAEAASASIGSIGLLVDPKSANAEAFYARRGFRDLGGGRWFIATKTLSMARERPRSAPSSPEPRSSDSLRRDLAQVARFTLRGLEASNKRPDEMRYFHDLETVGRVVAAGLENRENTVVPPPTAYQIYQESKDVGILTGPPVAQAMQRLITEAKGAIVTDRESAAVRDAFASTAIAFQQAWQVTLGRSSDEGRGA